MNKLKIEGFVVPVHLGCTPEERAFAQSVSFDIALRLDLSDCYRSDALDHTICHAQVSEAVACMVSGREWNLIEKLAFDSVTEILDKFPRLDKVKVSATKSIPGSEKKVTAIVERGR